MQKVTDSIFQRLLHENYNPALSDNLQRTSPEVGIFGGFKTEKNEGRYWREVAQTEGNFYMAARLEDETLPGYDTSGLAEDQIAGIDTLEAKYYVKKLYQSVNFTDLMEEITNGGKTGFQNLARLKMKDISKNIKESIAQRLAGTALGTEARISAINTTTGVVTFSPMSANYPEGGNRNIHVGTVYDAMNQGRASAKRVAVGDRGRRCTARGKVIPTSGSPTATFNNLTGCTWAAGDFLVRYNSRGDAAVSSSSDWDNLKLPWGIQDVVDDGTNCPYIGGVDRTLNVSYQAQIQDTGALHDPTLPEINQLVEAIDITSGGDIKWLYCFPSHRRMLMKFLTAQVAVEDGGGAWRSGAGAETPNRYMSPGSDNVNIGYGDVGVTTIGGSGTLRIKTSRLAAMHTVFAIDPSVMKILQLKEPGFLSADGLTVRKAFGKASYYADYAWFTSGPVCESHWKLGAIRSLAGSPDTAG